MPVLFILYHVWPIRPIAPLVLVTWLDRESLADDMVVVSDYLGWSVLVLLSRADALSGVPTFTPAARYPGLHLLTKAAASVGTQDHKYEL